MFSIISKLWHKPVNELEKPICTNSKSIDTNSKPIDTIAKLQEFVRLTQRYFALLEERDTNKSKSITIHNCMATHKPSIYTSRKNMI